MAGRPKKEAEKVKEETPVVASAPKGEVVISDPRDAEKVQVATGVIPSVTGNRLENSRKYTFKGVTAEQVKEILTKK